VNLMDSLKNRVSYLQGLLEGMEIDTSAKEGKILAEIVAILNEVSEEIEILHEDDGDLEEYVDNIDEDLADVEELLYDEDYDDLNEEDDDFIEIKCDNCGETVYIDENIMSNEKSITCPNCHNTINFKDSNCCCDK
jgi:formylmethanofuran dehydrogenase subunit E